MTPLQQELVRIVGAEPDVIEFRELQDGHVVLGMTWGDGLNVTLDEDAEFIEAMAVKPGEEATSALVRALLVLFTNTQPEGTT
jgi:hypothetical protein